MIPKRKKIRLTGKKLAALNAKIHERDHGCILCGVYVDPGEKFHHEPGGADKEDREECAAILCKKCHYERHFGKLLRIFKQRVIEYLKKRYPDYWGCMY